MRMFLREAVALYSGVYDMELPDSVIDLIGDFGGLPVIRDAPRREGECSFTNLNKEWQRLTRCGRGSQSKADHARDNATVGSAFNPPITDPPCAKNNNGVMHSGSGHISHFWISIGRDIEGRMKGCPWQVRLVTIDQEVEDMIVELKEKLNILMGCPIVKGLRN